MVSYLIVSLKSNRCPPSRPVRFSGALINSAVYYSNRENSFKIIKIEQAQVGSIGIKNGVNNLVKRSL